MFVPCVWDHLIVLSSYILCERFWILVVSAQIFLACVYFADQIITILNLFCKNRFNKNACANLIYKKLNLFKPCKFYILCQQSKASDENIIHVCSYFYSLTWKIYICSTVHQEKKTIEHQFMQQTLKMIYYLCNSKIQWLYFEIPKALCKKQKIMMFLNYS